MKHVFLVAAAVAALATGASSAVAATNLVQNGGFETTTLTRSQQFIGEVSNWSNATTTGYTGYGYNFLIKSGQSADGSGFYSIPGVNHDYVYGPNGTATQQINGQTVSNQSNNGFTSTSPSGGNFLLMDGDPDFHGAVSQTITGLTVGQAYNLTFDWAGISYFTTPGITTQRFDVSLGNVTQSTATLTTPAKGFSGWQSGSMTFTAGAASQTLSFLAQGTPNGLPPSLLLDNVSLTAAVPEASTWAMMVVGFGVVGGALRSRRRNTAVFA